MKKRSNYFIVLCAMCLGLLPGILFATSAMRSQTAEEAAATVEESSASVCAVAAVNSSLSRLRGIPVSITGVSAANAVYTGEPHPGYTGEPASAYDGAYEITYNGRGATAYGPTSAMPTSAGSYAVTFAVPESNPFYAGSVSLDFTIWRTDSAGAPAYTPITESGKTLLDAGLTHVGGTFSTPGSVAWLTDSAAPVEAGMPYVWIFTPEDSGNYNALVGTIVLYPTPEAPDAEGTDAEDDENDEAGVYDGVFTNPEGSIILGVSAASGSSYQWQVNRNDGKGWANIPEATHSFYTTPPLMPDDLGHRYRCVIERDEVSEISEVYTVTSITPAPDLFYSLDGSIGFGGMGSISEEKMEN